MNDQHRKGKRNFYQLLFNIQIVIYCGIVTLALYKYTNVFSYCRESDFSFLPL